MIVFPFKFGEIYAKPYYGDNCCFIDCVFG
jgi:hypothetical protein